MYIYNVYHKLDDEMHREYMEEVIHDLVEYVMIKVRVEFVLLINDIYFHKFVFVDLMINLKVIVDHIVLIDE